MEETEEGHVRGKPAIIIGAILFVLGITAPIWLPFVVPAANDDIEGAVRGASLWVAALLGAGGASLALWGVVGLRRGRAERDGR